MKFRAVLGSLAIGLALVLGQPCAASFLRPAKLNSSQPQPAVQAKHLHEQLETIATRLDSMLQDRGGAIAHSEAGPALKLFVKELHSVLHETSAEGNATVSLRKLEATKTEVAGLLKELATRQESLMREDIEQRESLLLGLLLRGQKEPLSKQLDILRAADFKDLLVSQALLAKRDAKRALYLQAADFLDKQDKQSSSTAASSGMAVNQKVQRIISVLGKHVSSLKREYSARERYHTKRRAAELKALKHNTLSSPERHIAEARLKKEERLFQRWASQRQHDISSVQAAVDAVRGGDVAAIERARAALTASVKALQSQNGGFLYLLQVGYSVMGRDCPYCAAQCVDACHQSGKPYVQCLSDCADAGKGK